MKKEGLGTGDWGLENKFATHIHALLSPTFLPAPSTQSLEPHFAVALSGGADSLACTLLADGWARAHGGRITALTVDHGLRAESAAEAKTVAAMMAARGITHHILTPPHTDVSRNTLEAARQWRYDALADFCRAQGILHCLVAHNAGDNRETAALHQARGDTADGASGMAAVRNYRGVRFVRPLLAIERAEIEEYLRAQNAAWIEDPSNANPRFARVRLRQTLAGDAAQTAALDASLAHAAAERAARDNALAEATITCVTIHPLGYAEISLAAWRILDALIASQLLADCITTISGATHRPRAADTARLIAALATAPFRMRTLQHCEITLRGDTLRIARERARVAPPLPLTGHGDATWDGRFSVRYALPAGETYTLQALGADGKKQLPHFSACPVPLSSPSVWHLDKLLFVPHMASAPLPHAIPIRIGFAPAKPLAATPFWSSL